MKKISVLLILTIILFSNTINAQIWIIGGKKIYGNGQETLKTIPISNFNKLRVVGNLEVEFDSTLDSEVRIEGEQNLISYIKIKVNNKGKLSIINPVKHQLKSTNGNKIKVNIPFKNLDDISLSGSGIVNLSLPIETNKIEATLRGSGKIILHSITNEIEAKISGSGFIEMNGTSKNTNITVRGSGKIDASDLKTEKGMVLASGEALIKINSIENYSIKKRGEARVTNKNKVSFRVTE